MGVGRKCAEESAAFEGRARSAAKPAARPCTNRIGRALRVALPPAGSSRLWGGSAPQSASVSNRPTLVAYQAKSVTANTRAMRSAATFLLVGENPTAIKLSDINRRPVNLATSRFVPTMTMRRASRSTSTCRQRPQQKRKLTPAGTFSMQFGKLTSHIA